MNDLYNSDKKTLKYFLKREDPIRDKTDRRGATVILDVEHFT